MSLVEWAQSHALSWTHAHALEFPGHQAFAGRRFAEDEPDAGSCETCGARNEE